jgi:pimeloyl-ACP methyl ester carboxylesterase
MPQFTSHDGIEIAYYEWGTPGPLPPVLLHHGFISNATSNWVTPGVVRALTDTGRQVVALDARGHGASDKPHDPGRYGEDTMAQDLRQLIDLLGVAQVDLVGYSMGAVVALIAASQDARIRRLVVGGVGGGLVEPGAWDRRRTFMTAVAAALRAADPSTIPDPVAQAFRAFADYVGGDREALAACAAAVHVTDIPLNRITAPTLVIAGDSDPIAARPEVLAAAIPNARVVILPGDHLAVVRNSRFAPAIVEFLAG